MYINEAGFFLHSFGRIYFQFCSYLALVNWFSSIVAIVVHITIVAYNAMPTEKKIGIYE